MRLEGIDGGQLWGFMVALGVLRLLDEDARARGAEVPRLHFDRDAVAVLGTDLDEGAVVAALQAGLGARLSYYAGTLSDIDCPKNLTRERFDELLSVATGWQWDVLAGLACSTGDGMAESTLCAANGAGHQNLIQSIRDVLMLVEPLHLHAALFAAWSRAYEVPSDVRKRLLLGSRKPTLRLDPADERLYALRADDPTASTAVFRTEIGAQALAVPAFEVLPVLPAARPRCIASRVARQRVYFEWCLWTPPSTLASVRSLLVLGPGSQHDVRHRGTWAAFRAARVTGDKGKLSIAPTTGLW